MGTRAIIHVKDDHTPNTLCTIYRQYDGYPYGLGEDIKKALGGRELVNGYSNPKTQVNGMGCAAAMLIAALKGNRCGNVYIYPPDSEGVGEEYVYTLYAKDGAICLKVCGYDGPLSEFDGDNVEKEE